MNINWFPSIITNLAFMFFISLTSATFFSSFANFRLSLSIGAAILIITPLFLHFSKEGISASSFLFTPSFVVTIVIVFSASLIIISIWLFMFCLPLMLPLKSEGSTNFIPWVNRVLNSPRISSSFKVSNLFDLSCAFLIKFFLTLSTTSSGFNAINHMFLI